MSDDTIFSTVNNASTVKSLLIHRLQAGQEPVRSVHPYYQPWVPASNSPSSASSSRDGPRPPPGCPMHTDKSTSSGSMSSSAASVAKLNPLNNMPTLSQDRAKNQKVELSTERTTSSIPRSKLSAAPGASPYDKPSACPVPHDQRSGAGGEKENSQGNWEYPSAQQFYNALVRKGWETPEEHVEMMVLVHNFLNERAWREVQDWEREMGVDAEKLSLARFQGRPGTISPKARLFSWAAAIAPSRFSSEPPFDRHDWIVQRPPTQGDAQGKQIRYVIDYYSEPDDPTTDEPVFFLDVRPALDSLEAVQIRLKRGWTEWQQGQHSETKRHTQAE